MKRIISMALVAMVAGCASGGSERAAFPDASRAYPSGGTYINLDDLRQYGEGMSKHQLQALLGTPHFNEGMWGVREWNYVFNLRPSPGAAAVRCQFQVRFDGAGVANGHAWLPASCGALLEPPPAVPPPPAAASKAPLRIAADALFAFDSAELTDAGRQALRQALPARLGTAVQLTVTGHTDRIGNADYNQRLSEQRAAAVRRHLVDELGLADASVSASGRGSTEPVVECQDSPRATLVACLAPNRRVEIAGISQ